MSPSATTPPPAPLDRLLWEPLLRAALAEDLGRAGDLTTDAIVPAALTARARLVARKAGRIAGLPMALAVFDLLAPGFTVRVERAEGSDVEAGTTLALISGPARALLTGERTALNLLGHLSGIATATRAAVAATAGTRAQVVCTRKTTLTLRALEKYAVRVGGGRNHRFGLDDAILIKDNHRVIAGGVTAAIERARGYAGHLVKIEVEVESLAQLDAALAAGVDVVMLDNMGLEEMAAAVARVAGRALTEASGGITPDGVAAVAATGVDLISLGWLTHSAPNLDVALDVVLDGEAR